MRLLAHVCCGPCASGTLGHLRSVADEVTGLFYNPNIHPFMEFRRRLTGARDLATDQAVRLAEDLAYDPAVWFEAVAGDRDQRCLRCIGLRLSETARAAGAMGAEAFTTTLSVSPWQDHEVIRVAGTEAARATGVEFLYEDLRRLYPDSRREARRLGLYRQKYCGCLVSEWERYRGHTGAED